MKDKIKYIIFSSFILLLILPAIQNYFEPIELKPLEGAFVLAEKPDSLKAHWFSGRYQTEYSQYLEDHIGFRNFFVRLYNQYLYSIFRTANYKAAFVGKDGYMFDLRYYYATCGIDFIGTSEIENKVGKLKVIQDSLKEAGITLIVVLAPNKARFYDEKIPSFIRRAQSDTTNYSTYLQSFRNHNINLIDFNHYFLQMKDSCRYPLIPKQGIHWSLYGAYLATDSLIRYIEKMNKIDMPDYHLLEIEISDSLRGTDYDIGSAMNLCFEMSHPKMAYPILEFTEPEEKRPASILAIGDSYYFMIYKSEFMIKCFAPSSEFWYYFKTVLPESRDKKISSLDLGKEIASHDVILLMVTEFNLNEFAFGSIDSMYNELIVKNQLLQQKLVFYKQNIMKDASLVADLKKEAESLKSDFSYILEQKALKLYKKDEFEKIKQIRITHYIKRIREEKDWLDKIKLQALERNLPLDTMIYRNALFMTMKELEEE